MDKNFFYKNLSLLGYQLLHTDEPQDVDLTIAEIIKSNDVRLWEGFPIVLANAQEKSLFDKDKVENNLDNEEQKKVFQELLVMSLALYKTLNLNFSWSKKLLSKMTNVEKNKINFIRNNLVSRKDFDLGGTKMSCERLLSTMNNYLSETQQKYNDLVSRKSQLGLEYSLSQLLSPKQKELFFKKLRREKLTKTEKEYYSRVVKKKVIALANQDVNQLSQKLLEEK